MASVDKNIYNHVTATTAIVPVKDTKNPFDDEILFAADASNAIQSGGPIASQDIDAAYGRALNRGRGVVGEGGAGGPGVVGIAGGVLMSTWALYAEPQLGRGWRSGVVGFGADPVVRERDTAGSYPNAIGVVGFAAQSIGVWGTSVAQPGVFGSTVSHAGVYGLSSSTGIVGDASSGTVGVEGVGNQWGVYGHVNFATPNADGAGVFGAASYNLDGTYIGRAGVFAGPVDVNGDLTVLGDQILFGKKGAAAKHDDGTYRLLYCIESPESQFEDFGEASLVKGAAKVKLDRDFVAVADTRHYDVFLTPYGDSMGLYVSERSRNGFQVREQGGGTSRLKFSYRVVAKRKHVEAKRFQKVKRPKKPKLPTSLQRPDIDVQPRKTTGKGRAKSKPSKQ